MGRKALQWAFLNTILGCCVFGFLASPLAADTVTNFTIQSATNYQQSGGTFDGKGSYRGTFTIDQNAYASATAGQPSVGILTNYDFFATAPGSSTVLEFTPQNSDSGYLIKFSCFATGVFYLPEMCEDGINVSEEIPGPNGSEIQNVFSFNLIEPSSVIYGTTILYADLTLGPNFTLFVDNSSDTIIIDPAAVPPIVPEPATWGLTGSFLALIFCVRYLRWRSRHSGLGEYPPFELISSRLIGWLRARSALYCGR